ncbi:unknown [Clostridium sp. CAG:729]|nr:unknown [Clostridium sp. CAG:729]
MSLSHQKISLARELADLSNEYQNSLDQSKLIYDYYGTGDTNTPLSYGILMSPSALNDYMPQINLRLLWNR